ncbi:hypothetical protein Tco_1276467, partial [Tanacetum coccineum]
DDMKDKEELEECEEDKANIIIGTIVSKLHQEWFNDTKEDEDGLEEIIDYLEPTSFHGFINLNGEGYKERRCKMLEMPYKKPPPI